MFQVTHQPGFQSFENQPICPLGLPIRLRMSDRSVIDSRALGGTKGSEFFRIEVRAVICDDAVWDAISEYQFPDETHRCTCSKVFNGLGFDPFGELVDCHQHMSKSTPASPQRSNHVQSLDGKRPDEWNCFQS